MPTRKNRCAWRKRSGRNLRGGRAPIGDSSMVMSMKDSLAQGGQFVSLHRAQHGGAVGPYPSSVTGSVLSGSMIPAARTGPLDVAISAAQRMHDGGSRRKKSRKNKKSRKVKKGKKTRKSLRGGAAFAGASLSASPMILPSSLVAKAGLNNEWSLASNPNSFAPKR